MSDDAIQDYAALKRSQSSIQQQFFLQLFLLLVGAFFLTNHLNPRLPIYHVAVMAGCLFIYLISILYRYQQKKFVRAYKQQFVSTVIHGILPETSFEFDQHLPHSSLIKSGFFLESALLRGSNLVSCQYQDAQIRFSDIALQPFPSRVANEKPIILPGQLFLGIVVEVMFEKSFPGTPLMILHQKMQHLRLPNVYQQTPIEAIKTLSPEFNKTFYVRGADQVMSRKLLQPALIERITRLAAQQPMSLSFLDNQLYIVLPHVRLAFETHSFLLPLKHMASQLPQIQASVTLIKTMIDTLGL